MTEISTGRRWLPRAPCSRAPASASGQGWCPVSRRQAQTAGRRPSADAPIWSAEYWASKGDVRLNLWRKRVGAPRPGEPPLPVLFLVHGSSNSARSSYDLDRAGQGRILAHERVRALRLRRLDHGPRRLRPLRQLRQQLRHRQRRRGPQGRDPGGGAGDRAGTGCISTARRRARSAPAPMRRQSPSASTGWCWSPSPTRAPARRRSAGAAARSRSCAPTPAASATPP